jgi:hypothetical protein
VLIIKYLPKFTSCVFAHFLRTCCHEKNQYLSGKGADLYATKTAPILSTLQMHGQVALQSGEVI